MSDREALSEIIGRFADDVATIEEMSQLERALRADAVVRRNYLRYLNLDAALAGGAAAWSEPQSRAPAARTRRRTLVAAAAILLVTTIATGVWYIRERGSSANDVKVFAALVAARNAAWSDPNIELALRGGELPAGILRLEAGTAEFAFADGATIVLQSPAAVRFVDRKQVFVEHGRVFCRCPTPESRLLIETATTEVLDLGTEFSVEARADRSTVVAVLSGEVQVGKSVERRLHQGESLEILSNGLLAVRPLSPDEFAELLRASPAVDEAVRRGRNVLLDPGFEDGLSERTWNGTEANIRVVLAGGRAGNAVRVAAGGFAQFPQCRQKTERGDYAGRLIVASVWGAVNEGPLSPRQSALLKIVFEDESGREIGFAMRPFLGPHSQPGRFERAEAAAIAPAGTKRVQIQLMLRTGRQVGGSVLFDDAGLIVAETDSH